MKKIIAACAVVMSCLVLGAKNVTVWFETAWKGDSEVFTNQTAIGWNYVTNVESGVTLPTPVLDRPGYRRLSIWMVTASGAPYGVPMTGGSIQVPEVAAIMATAQWNLNSYDIIFDANGGSGSMDAIAGVSYTNTVKLAPCAFTRPYRSFEGWAATEGGAVMWADGAEVKELTEDATNRMFAVWKDIEYTVSFDANGGSGVAMPELTATVASRFELGKCTFKRPGFEFVGWAREPKAAKYEFADEAKVDVDKVFTGAAGEASEKTLYAIWQGESYDVALDANGGTVSPESIQVTTGSVYGKLPVPVRSGYEFAGWWYATLDGLVQALPDGEAAAKSDASSKLYARWRKAPAAPEVDCEVVFSAEGGVFADGAVTNLVRAAGAKLGYLPAATRVDGGTNFTLVGWYTEPLTLGVRADENSRVTADMVLYARWLEPQDAIGEALDCEALRFHAAEGGDWIITNRIHITDLGSDVVMTPRVYEGNDATLLAEISGKGVLRFDWTCSAMSNPATYGDSTGAGYFEFFVVDGDAETTNRISDINNFTAATSWTTVEIEFTNATSRTVAWRYHQKANPVNWNNPTHGNCGWLDKVSWTDAGDAGEVEVAFDGNGGGFSTNLVFAVGEPYSASEPFPAPMRSGFHFAGWFSAPEGGVEIRESDIADAFLTRLYGHWTESPVPAGTLAEALDCDTLDFETGDPGTDPVWYAQGEVFEVGASAARSWPVGAGGESEMHAELPAVGVLSFRWRASSEPGFVDPASGAKVECDRVEFRLGGTLVATLSGATGWEQVSVSNLEASAVASWRFVRDGKNSEWGFSPSLEDCAWVDGVAWEKLRYYKVSFDPNGGNGQMADETFAAGAARPLESNAFTRVGHTFAGWSRNAAGPVEFSDGQVVSNLTDQDGGVVALYAIWAPVSYTVAFDGCGGIGAMDNMQFVYGVSQALAANSFVRPGYTFAGWAETRGGAVAWADGESVSNLADSAGAVKTLYAVWEGGIWPVDGPFDSSAARIYDGWLADGSGAIAGTVQVKTAKRTVKTVTDRVTKEKSVVTNVAVTATVVAPDGKKWSYTKGSADATGSVTGLVCTAKGVPVPSFEVQLGADGMSGEWGEFVIAGSRNGMSVKDDWMKADLVECYQKSWSVTFADGTRLQFTVQAGGKTKIAGTTADGFKVSATVQGVMGEDVLRVPALLTLKNGRQTRELKLLVALAADGMVAAEDSSLGDVAEGGATRAPEIIGFEPSATLHEGVAWNETVKIAELGYPAKFSAVKLPTGLKIDSATGVVSGVPTKAGTWTATIKVTSAVNSKWVQTADKTYTVAAMKEWAFGTFNGGGDGCSVQFTIAKGTAKTSGKLMENGTNWTLSAASFTAFDGITYTGSMVAKAGKAAFTNDFTVAEEPIGGSSRGRAEGFGAAGGWTAWKNLWKEPEWKAYAAAIAKDVKSAMRYVTKTGAVTAEAPAAEELFGTLEFKFSASASVSVAGKFTIGQTAAGRDIVYSASASTTLVPGTNGGCVVFVYLPPKAGKFDGLAGMVEFPDL